MAVRTSVVLAGGGEFGVALVTMLVPNHTVLGPELSQPLLAAIAPKDASGRSSRSSGCRCGPGNTSFTPIITAP